MTTALGLACLMACGGVTLAQARTGAGGVGASGQQVRNAGASSAAGGEEAGDSSDSPRAAGDGAAGGGRLAPAPRLQASQRFAALAPLPPPRPADYGRETHLPNSGRQAAAAAETGAGGAAELSGYAAPATGSSGLFMFLSGKTSGTGSSLKGRQGAPAVAVSAPEEQRRHGQLSRGAARDAAARARVAELIARHARAHGVPVALADAVVRVESRYNPSARNGPYMGLMQIHVSTARSMGYAGTPQGLLDPDVNLRYGMKYLAGAYRLAGGDTCGTIMKYQGGHRAVRLSAHAARYCSRVRTMMAAH